MLGTQDVPTKHQVSIHLVKFICFLSLLLSAPLCSNSVFFSPPYFPVIFFITLEDINQKHLTLFRVHAEAPELRCKRVAECGHILPISQHLTPAFRRLHGACKGSASPGPAAQVGREVERWKPAEMPRGCCRAPLMQKPGNPVTHGGDLRSCSTRRAAFYTCLAPGRARRQRCERRGRKPGSRCTRSRCQRSSPSPLPPLLPVPSRLPAAGEKPLIAPCAGYRELPAHRRRLACYPTSTAAATRGEKSKCPGGAGTPDKALSGVTQPHVPARLQR